MKIIFIMVFLSAFIVAAAKAEVVRWYSESSGKEYIVIDGTQYNHFVIVGNREDLNRFFRSEQIHKNGVPVELLFSDSREKPEYWNAVISGCRKNYDGKDCMVKIENEDPLRQLQR